MRRPFWTGARRLERSSDSTRTPSLFASPSKGWPLMVTGSYWFMPGTKRRAGFSPTWGTAGWRAFYWTSESPGFNWRHRREVSVSTGRARWICEWIEQRGEQPASSWQAFPKTRWFAFSRGLARKGGRGASPGESSGGERPTGICPRLENWRAPSSNPFPGAPGGTRIHPATRVFQALRIAVNRELDALEAFLQELPDLLEKGGRFCVISFHSLEDRLVKEAMQRWERGCRCPADRALSCSCHGEPLLRRVRRKALRPSPAEVERNPLSRSARLRIAERV